MSAQVENRKLVYHIGISVDGYIAREDESVDGMMFEGEHVTDFVESLHNYGAILMGKRTYEWGCRMGMRPGDVPYPFTGLTTYVFSQSLDDFSREHLQVVRSDPAEYVRILKHQEGKPIWLCGGGQLASYLLDHNLIDDLVLKVYPVVFGKGIPLFNTIKPQLLCLNSTRTYTNGVSVASYTIRRQ
jgi:dihydrofolate reductase